MVETILAARAGRYDRVYFPHKTKKNFPICREARYFKNSPIVYLVNSGAGFEAMIHGKPIVRFGHAEYDRVVPQAAAEVVSIARQTAEADIPRYAAFLDGYLSACISLADASSYARVLG